MGIVIQDSNRSLKTLGIIEPLLGTSYVTRQQINARIRSSDNPYNWVNGKSPELNADLTYLHGISGLTESSGGYTRGKLTDYWLGRV